MSGRSFPTNTTEADRLRIALASDEQLAEWLREGQGGREFLWEVHEALSTRTAIYEQGVAAERRRM